MLKYDSRGSLAPRDIVARAIDTEMKSSGEEHVFLDGRHLDKNGLKKSFPNIYDKCKSIGNNIEPSHISICISNVFISFS